MSSATDTRLVLAGLASAVLAGLSSQFVRGFMVHRSIPGIIQLMMILAAVAAPSVAWLCCSVLVARREIPKAVRCAVLAIAQIGLVALGWAWGVLAFSASGSGGFFVLLYGGFSILPLVASPLMLIPRTTRVVGLMGSVALLFVTGSFCLASRCH